MNKKYYTQRELIDLIYEEEELGKLTTNNEVLELLLTWYELYFPAKEGELFITKGLDLPVRIKKIYPWNDKDNTIKLEINTVIPSKWAKLLFTHCH